ncbi:MAG: ATP-dependent helicase [Myxococcota bacterium]
MLDLSGLNHAQMEAVVTTDGPLLVLAGAGSGKTRVITYRLAHLIQKGVPARNILCVTFTNKAAREMRERARTLIGRSLRGTTLSTFHALGVRILRTFGSRIGLQSTFGITDASDQLGSVRRILRSLRIDDRRFDAKRILSAITWAKNAGFNPQAFEDCTPPDGLLPDDELYLVASCEVYRRYEDSLRAQNLVDFDDLLLQTKRLLEEQPTVRSELADRFRYVMVDEYQDTNGAQLDVLKTIVAPRNNLCVVGDDDQSIYGWRGADVRNILMFEEHFAGARRVTLDLNYRSTRAILEAANGLIAPNTNRWPKRLRSALGDGENVDVVAYERDEDEAEGVANRVIALQAGGTRLSDIAVLYRSNIQSRPLEMAFRHAHLPYRVVGGMDLFERKELKDAIAYLRFLANPQDEQSLRRILNVPPRGIGSTTVKRVDDWARERHLHFSEGLHRAHEVQGLSTKSADAIVDFLDLIRDLRARLGRVKASTVVKRMFELVRFESFIHEGTDDGTVAARRIDNVRDLVRQLERYERRKRSGRSDDGEGSEDEADVSVEPEPLDQEGEVLGQFLADLALLGMEDAPNQTEPRDVVTLSTIHAAKGLEWPDVFLVGVEEGLLPHRRVAEEGGSVDEERRLMYVAVTRARRRVAISYAKTRTRFGQDIPRQPSRFLDDLPEDQVDRRDLRPMERTQEEKEAIAEHWRAKIRAQLGLEKS